MTKKQKTTQKSNSVAKKSSYQAPDLTVFILKKNTQEFLT